MANNPPTQPGPLSKPESNQDSMATYHKVADTVGGVPNLRLKDNVVQTIVVLASAMLGALVGCTLIWTKTIDWELYLAAGAGGIAGLILGTFVSGLVLMVMGWVRATKK